jgi:hypothetical protein
MEKNTQHLLGSKVILPHVQKDISLGALNLTSNREIIPIPSGAWVGIEQKYLIRIITPFRSSVYNPRYYDLKASDKTQKKTIEKALKHILPHTVKNKDISKTVSTKTPKQITTQPTKTVDTELNQIVLIERLIKKVVSWNTRREKAKTTKDQDKFILLGRQLKKDRTLIDSILSTLKQDSCFSIKDNYIHYNGQFASCKRLLPDGGF